jgi:hypothetical protein
MEAVVARLGVLLWHMPNAIETEENHEQLFCYSQSPSRYLNQGHPEYEAGN